MDSWFNRTGAVDVRLLAAIGATVLLIIGVMWVVPTTPTSNSFTFDSARRGMEDARPIELETLVQGNIVDGSDADFYKITPLKASYRLDVRMTTGSANMVPGLRIFDATRNLVQDKTVEYVRSPGSSIETSFLAQSSMIYYFQVFTQRNTTGPYTLTVNIRRP